MSQKPGLYITFTILPLGIPAITNDRILSKTEEDLCVFL